MGGKEWQKLQPPAHLQYSEVLLQCVCMFKKYKITSEGNNEKPAVKYSKHMNN